MHNVMSTVSKLLTYTLASMMLAFVLLVPMHAVKADTFYMSACEYNPLNNGFVNCGSQMYTYVVNLTKNTYITNEPILVSGSIATAVCSNAEYASGYTASLTALPSFSAAAPQVVAQGLPAQVKGGGGPVAGSVTFPGATTPGVYNMHFVGYGKTFNPLHEGPYLYTCPANFTLVNNGMVMCTPNSSGTCLYGYTYDSENGCLPPVASSGFCPAGYVYNSGSDPASCDVPQVIATINSNYYSSYFNTASVHYDYPFTVTAPALPAAPSSISATCGSGGTSVTLSWPSASGAVSYNPRVGGGNISSSCASGWIFASPSTCYKNSISGNSITYSGITPGVSYSAWVHSTDGAGNTNWNSPPTTNFTCAAPVICTDTNATNYNAAGPCTCKSGYALVAGICAPNPGPSTCTDTNASNYGATGACTCKSGYTFNGSGICTAICTDTNATNYNAAGPCTCKSGYALVAGICAAQPQLTIIAIPQHVKLGNTATISYSAQYVTSCTLITPSGSTPITPIGGMVATSSLQTAPVTGPQNYRLTCDGTSVQVTVGLLPQYIER